MKQEHTLKFVMILTLTMVIIMTGCSTSGSSTPVYKVGTDGLVLEFSKSNPTSVYEEEEFGTSLFVRNIGSYSVTGAKTATLRLIYDNYRLNNKSANNEIYGISLEGKSTYYPQGSETSIDFYFESNRLTELRESSKTEITYNLCYPYVTEYTTMTCIDTKTANKADRAAACTAEVYNGMAGQGAPIVITKIEPEIMLQQDYVRPQYKIYVENLGKGYVMNRIGCDISNIRDLFGTGYNDFSGRVNVHAELSGQTLDCGPDRTGVLRLVDSNSYITCSLPKNANAAGFSRTKNNYLTPLTVRIDYTYVLLDKQEIEIKHNDLIEQKVTQGMCLSYQVEYDGKCMDKCVYCSKNPKDLYNCNIATASTENSKTAVFGSNFGCTCKLAQCNDKIKDGNCIKGFCNGELYCCSNSQCDEYQVEYNGKCLDKCDFCFLHPTHSKCKGLASLSGFSCTSMSKDECKAYGEKGNCYLGLCGGPNKDTMYCANIQNIECGVNEKKYGGHCLSLCEYCSQYGTAEDDDICKYYGATDATTNQAQVYRVGSSFTCSCTEPGYNTNLPVTNIPNDKIISDTKFCLNNKYCCDSAGYEQWKTDQCTSKNNKFTDGIKYKYVLGSARCMTDCEYCEIATTNSISPILGISCAEFKRVLENSNDNNYANVYASCKEYHNW